MTDRIVISISKVTIFPIYNYLPDSYMTNFLFYNYKSSALASIGNALNALMMSTNF